jgi:hypothetical protein
MKAASFLALSAVGSASAQLNICSLTNISNATANYCSCKGATIAGNPIATIDCSIGDAKDAFYANANVTLFPCSKTAEFVVSLEANGANYGTYECLLGQTQHIKIPGLAIDVSVGGKKIEAQAYVDMSMQGNTKDFVAQIDLDFCAEFWGVNLCGEDLSPSLPFNLITGELTTTGICS